LKTIKEVEIDKASIIKILIFFKKNIFIMCAVLFFYICEKKIQLLKDKEYLLNVLKKGREKSIELSYNKLYEVKKAIGLIT
jgi:hypothetical protein